MAVKRIKSGIHIDNNYCHLFINRCVRFEVAVYQHVASEKNSLCLLQTKENDFSVCFQEICHQNLLSTSDR